MAFTGILRFAVAVFAFGVAESVTFAVKLNVPDAVGVPVIWPEVLRFNPPGSAPLVILHV